MIKIIVTLILSLHPTMPRGKAMKYADLIAFEAEWYRVHPALVISIIQVESRWHNGKVSKTNDYGLAQIHVNRGGSNRFYGREKLLFNPRINIREGVRLLDMWRTYHNTWCKKAHPYWTHYKWGRRVKGTKHAKKVSALFRRLKEQMNSMGGSV